MSGVRVSEHVGVVIRKATLESHHISRLSLLALMEAGAPFDEDHMLISFGPHVGGEAAQTLMHRLEHAGLQYGIDYLDVSDSVPDWLHLSVQLATPPSATRHDDQQALPDLTTLSSDTIAELSSDMLLQYLHHHWRAPIVAALGLTEVLQTPGAGPLTEDQQRLLDSLHHKLTQMNQGFVSLTVWLKKRQPAD